MLKTIILVVALNGSIDALPPQPVKIEMRRRRGKQSKGRRRGGNGIR